MPIVQQASGTFNGLNTLTATLPGASSASNTVVLFVAGNTTVTTPTNWSLRTSQVNSMGHYLYERAGVALTSISTNNAAGAGTWWIAEIAGGVYDTSAGQNAGAAGSGTYNTPTTFTPAAGNRIILADLGSLVGNATVRTLSGWTNSFVEQIDVCQPTADYPMQGGAALDGVTANGSTTYSTTGTYSNASIGRSALVGSWATSGAASATRFRTMSKRR